MHDTAIVILIHCEDKLISMTFNSWITFAHRFSIKDCCVLLPGDEEEAAPAACSERVANIPNQNILRHTN